jgi:hypothetical protein
LTETVDVTGEDAAPLGLSLMQCKAFKGLRERNWGSAVPSLYTLWALSKKKSTD